MTAKDYLTALRVVREIQRKQASRFGRTDICLSDTLFLIESYCPLDFSRTCGRLVKDSMIESYSGKLF